MNLHAGNRHTHTRVTCFFFFLSSSVWLTSIRHGNHTVGLYSFFFSFILIFKMLRIQKKKTCCWLPDRWPQGVLPIDRSWCFFLFFFLRLSVAFVWIDPLSIVFKGMTTKERQMDPAWNATSDCCIVRRKTWTDENRNSRNIRQQKQLRERKKNSKNLGLTLIEEAMMWHEWRWPHSHTHRERLLAFLLLKFETKPTPRK